MQQAFLKIATAAEERRVPITQDRMTIGRHKDNVIVIDDTMASRFHGVVEWTGAGYVFHDLKSRNGSLVNGQRVATIALGANDVITIGSTQLTLVVEDVSDLQKAVDQAHREMARNTAGHEADDLEVVEEEGDDLEVVDDDDSAIEFDDAVNESPISKFRSIADAMPERTFDVDAIELINTRGKPLIDAAAGAAARGENVTILRLVLLICFRSQASDIHLEPRAEEYLLRIRVDGNIVDLAHLSRDTGTRLSAIVKLLCDLDTTQKTIVQEGHFAARAPLSSQSPQARSGVQSRRVDYRVSFVPTLYGQKLVVRVFDTANAPLLLDDLQMPPAVAAAINRQLTLATGIVLGCGPTGSGKTTTLYALLRSSGVSHRNIVTIEDPVEVQIEGATQLPVDEAEGKGFAALLRSVLRQDPDVIMVGEIRDAETAKIALQAAITGHMVLSTVHTRDTVGTIFRLLDLGIEPYMVAQGLSVVVAQRLMRKLCPSCRRAFTPSAEDLARLGPAGQNVRVLFAPAGCARCLGSGYSGRRAVFELLTVTDPIRERITKNPSPAEIHAVLANSSFVPLARAGALLVAEGVTSFDEMERSVAQ